jgi:hypothetical protein
MGGGGKRRGSRQVRLELSVSVPEPVGERGGPSGGTNRDLSALLIGWGAELSTGMQRTVG